MATAKKTVKVKGTGTAKSSSSGTKPCPRCGGTGRVKG